MFEKKMKANIMVIEDDEEITGKIKKCLEDNSFNVYILIIIIFNFTNKYLNFKLN